MYEYQKIDAVGRKRLRQLIRLLERDAKNKNGIKFDMANWGTVLDNKKPMSCDTVACAMGLAALSGKFQKAGLRWGTPYPTDIFLNSTDIGFFWRRKHVSGVRAAAALFHIPYDHANWLFTTWPDGYESGAKAERAMAKRLKAYLKDGERYIIRFADQLHAE